MNKVILLLLLVAISGIVTAKFHTVRKGRKSKLRNVFDPSKMKTFEMPKSCKNEGKEFCFDNINYPIDIVKDILKDVTGLVVADDDNEVSTTDAYTPRANECAASSTNKFIYYIVDEFGRDRVVVQMKGKFHQRFSLKWCKDEGPMLGRTKHFMKREVLTHKLYCKTEYINYDFFVLSTSPGYDGKWRMEKARTKTGIPVCCACRYDKKSR